MSKNRVRNRRNSRKAKSRNKQSRGRNRTTRQSRPNSASGHHHYNDNPNVGDITFTDDGFAIRWGSERTEEFVWEESIEGFIEGRLHNTIPGRPGYQPCFRGCHHSDLDRDISYSLLGALVINALSDPVSPTEIVLRTILGTDQQIDSLTDFDTWMNSPNRRVRMGLACCPSTPEDVLSFLMNDEDSDIRFAAFVNPNLGRGATASPQDGEEITFTSLFAGLGVGLVVHPPRFAEADDVVTVLANPEVSTQAIRMALSSGHSKTELLGIALGWDRLSGEDKAEVRKWCGSWESLGEWLNMENSSRTAIEARVVENLKRWRRFCDEQPDEAAALLATDPSGDALRIAISKFIFRWRPQGTRTQ